MEELLADELAVVARDADEALDLLGHLALLRQRELDGRDDVVELGARRFDARDHHVLVRVEEVLDEHHRVVPLLERLAVEVRGEVRQGLGVVVDGDRDVLLRGRELVPDLLVDGVPEPAHRRGL